MEPPPEAWCHIARQQLDLLKPMTVLALLGYLQSWSSYNAYKRQHPEAADPVQVFGEQVLQALNTHDASHQLTIRFPMFLVLAKRPSA